MDGIELQALDLVELAGGDARTECVPFLVGEDEYRPVPMILGIPQANSLAESGNLDAGAVEGTG